jgi:ABC-type glycerol-3-phosphate transport system permease component
VRKLSATTAKHGLLILLSVVSLYPIWFIIQTALKTQNSYTLNPTGLPSSPTFGNFTNVFQAMPFAQWLGNSALVAVVSVGVVTVIALLAAYAVAFGKFRGRAFFFNSNIALMALPPVALVVPLFLVMVQTGLVNTLPSVILVYTGLLVPFSVFFLVNFFRELPHELIESATIDGAPHWRILTRIVLPLSGATTATLMIVNAIWVWNELLFALVFLQDNNRRTLMAGMALYQGRYSTNEPLIMAGAFLSILPLVVFYIAGQRFFVRGLTAGIGK